MREWGMFVAGSAMALAAVALAAPRMTDAETASAWIAAAVICATTGIVALAPAGWLAPRHPTYLLEAGLAAIVLRLFGTLAAGFVYLRGAAPPKWAFLNALVVFYLVSLAADTLVTVRLAGRYWRAR